MEGTPAKKWIEPMTRSASRFIPCSKNVHALLVMAHPRRSMRALWFAFVSVLCFSQTALATLPWPTETVKSPSGRYSALLKPSRLTSLTICTNGSEFHVFGFEEFRVPEPADHSLTSTAGYLWYRKCMAFFDKSERHLIIRLKWGKWVIVDLARMAALPEMPATLQEEVDSTVKHQILTWLDSPEGWERENGAEYAGEMQMQEAIPRLKQLTYDPFKTDYKDGSGPWVKSYWVRKAALGALKKMGIRLQDVVVEEPKE